MRIRLASGVAAVAVAAGVVLGAVAPASAAPAVPSAAPSTVAEAQSRLDGGYFKVKGQTAIQLDTSFQSSLAFLGVQLHPVFVEQVVANGVTTLNLKVIGNPADGTTEHFGGLFLSSEKGCVLLSDLTVDSATGKVNARFNFGQNVDLFNLGANTSGGVTLALTKNGAAELTKHLSSTIKFRAGMNFGYFKTTLNPVS